MRNDDESKTGVTVFALLADLNNKAAWDHFVDRYAPRIYRWCVLRGLQDADARDVSQAVLVKLFVHLGTYDPDRGRFRTWLGRVVKNALNDFLRSQQRRHFQGVGDSWAQSILDSAEAGEDLAQAMDEEFERELLAEAKVVVQQRVEPSSWQAFILTALESWEPASVATHLGMTVTAVYMARHRIQKMLAREIARLEERPPRGGPSS